MSVRSLSGLVQTVGAQRVTSELRMRQMRCFDGVEIRAEQLGTIARGNLGRPRKRKKITREEGGPP